jgi:hypothetical protein
MRDFPSIILQQTGYAVSCLADHPSFQARRGELLALAAASARFWNWRALRYGAFEEYYPWEQGYPPLAFSTLAVAKMAAAGIASAEEVCLGLDRAAQQLCARFEDKATNQQCAGLAALAWLRHLNSEWVPDAVWNRLRDRTLACQHEEGWFMEYGGPDTGYLSVTLDCLWDAYDACGEMEFQESAAKALSLIEGYIALPGRGMGMHNARNTDYIMPYGIARFVRVPKYSGKALAILERLYKTLEEPEHVLHATDDRYIGHYIGHSLIRAVQVLQEAGAGAQTASLAVHPAYLPGAGHWRLLETPSGCSALISGKKGGICTLWFDAYSASDYGWLVREGNCCWVSHWWMSHWEVSINPSAWKMTVEGYLTAHHEQRSTPFKHAALRVLSGVFGRRIIGILKETMIFKSRKSKRVPFRRRIEFASLGVFVTDEISVPQSAVPERAPRSSKRHVASADSFHPEDLVLVDPSIRRTEERRWESGRWIILTEYSYSGSFLGKKRCVSNSLFSGRNN